MNQNASIDMSFSYFVSLNAFLYNLNILLILDSIYDSTIQCLLTEDMNSIAHLAILSTVGCSENLTKSRGFETPV